MKSALRLMSLSLGSSFQNVSRWCTILKEPNSAYFSGIYIVCGYTDLRYSIDSLAVIIEYKYHMNLFVPNTLFLFCGRSASKIKCLLWEGDCILLLYRRVESGHFTCPWSSDDLKSMSAEQFLWLMQGFAIKPVIALVRNISRLL